VPVRHLQRADPLRPRLHLHLPHYTQEQHIRVFTRGYGAQGGWKGGWGTGERERRRREERKEGMGLKVGVGMGATGGGEAGRGVRGGVVV